MARYGLPGDHVVALKFCGGHTSVFTPQWSRAYCCPLQVTWVYPKYVFLCCTRAWKCLYPYTSISCRMVWFFLTCISRTVPCVINTAWQNIGSALSIHMKACFCTVYAVCICWLYLWMKTFCSISCKPLQGDTRKTVKQFAYLAWPDMGIPETSEAMLKFAKEVRSHLPPPATSKGPIVVHCR